MKMGSAGLNNLILLDQVKGHCDTVGQIVKYPFFDDFPCWYCKTWPCCKDDCRRGAIKFIF